MTWVYTLDPYSQEPRTSTEQTLERFRPIDTTRTCIRGAFRTLPNIQQLYNTLKTSENHGFSSFSLISKTASS